MEYFILNGYELLTVVVPALVMAVIVSVLCKRKRKPKNRLYLVTVIVFAVYLFGVFHFTGAGTVFDAMRCGLDVRPDEINLIPFSDTDFSLVGYGLNLVLFLPLGFLLPFFCADFCKFRYAALFGFLLSVLVEASQLLNFRATDVDDLIINTVGAVFGMLLYRFFSCMTKHNFSPVKACKWEAFFYVCALFLCRFFTFDEFGMAKLLYGF